MIQSSEKILKQIECDSYNLQTMVNMLDSSLPKGEYRSIVASIKVLVKEIHNQKCAIEEKLFKELPRVEMPLFKVSPSPIEGLAKYNDIDSFFGEIS